MTGRVLVLILGSDGSELYKEFQKRWLKYMNSRPEVDCFFYKGDPNISGDHLSDMNTLMIKIEDTLDNVYEKTLRAFRFFEPTLHNYTHVFRTNLSSFVHLNKYVKYCSRCPTEKFVSAALGYHYDIVFPSGAGFTMTPDIVRRLLVDSPPNFVMDDVTIGKWLQSINVPIVPVTRIDYIYANYPPTIQHPEVMPFNSIFHWRIKGDDRSNDLRIYDSLIHSNYPIYALVANRS